MVLGKYADFPILRSRCRLPTRNVNLTPELDSFILDKVGAGLYANASEVCALLCASSNERSGSRR